MAEKQQPIQVVNDKIADNKQQLNILRSQQEQAAIEKIMTQQNNKYIASKSGFWYYYNHKVENDSLKTPDFGDIINYNYNVKRLNGNIIYSKEEIKTQSYAMDKQELFTGLREGLKLLKTGETATFLFPSQKAYGYYGDENRIPHNTPIICEVTVNSITTQNGLN